MTSDGTNGARVGENPLISTSASEIRALQFVTDDKPNSAQQVIDKMTGRDRALFAYYLRELGLMIENADGDAIADRRRASK